MNSGNTKRENSIKIENSETLVTDLERISFFLNLIFTKGNEINFSFKIQLSTDRFLNLSLTLG